MPEQQGGSYHPGVVDIETPSEIPSGTEDRFADVEIRRDVLAGNVFRSPFLFKMDRRISWSMGIIERLSPQN